MEKLKRHIKLFFFTYGNLLLPIVVVIAIVFITLKLTNYIYSINNDLQTNQTVKLSEEQIQQNKLKQDKINENKQFITRFLDDCNKHKASDAYKMLSTNCIKEKYQTLEIFQSSFIETIFPYEKEFLKPLQDVFQH